MEAKLIEKQLKNCFCQSGLRLVSEEYHKITDEGPGPKSTEQIVENKKQRLMTTMMNKHLPDAKHLRRRKRRQKCVTEFRSQNTLDVRRVKKK